ncbi:PepSY domain-containing protein [Paenibacillus sp. Marseille-Q4541]|uniref:PepSY domain-containing protein n=1 Tax=Paenibacillus sp. Marseille-Q4541 TaxID=2831522 RepID=UPI001BA56DDA|nr:PepSY domain-containing protein [Paenibacillus sp. Marseille-Q4541]
MTMKKRALYVGAAALVLIGLIVYFVQPWDRSAALLSAEAVEESVTSQYPGKVENSSLQNGQYHLRLSTDTGTYEVTVDGASGSILSIQQISSSVDTERVILSRDKVKQKILSEVEGELLFLELIPMGDHEIYKAKVMTKTERILLELDPYTAEELSRKTISIDEEEEDDRQKELFLTEEEVEKIALAEVAGKVEDTELRGESTSSPYYLVEIETASEKEAIIQIHAITGKIQSVTWDTED